MNRRALLAACALATMAVTAPAAAQTPSPRWGTFEFALSGYRPNIDAELPAAKPWSSIFGDGRGIMFRGDVSKTLLVWDQLGALDVGVGLGYFQRTGTGLKADLTPGSEEVKFRILPTRLTATFRYEALVEEYGIPLQPYARFSLERWWWWSLNASGNTTDANGVKGSGATNGYSFALGLAFLLDFVDPTLARDADRDTGVNHTYLFGEVSKNKIDDFGSKTSWDLSNANWTYSGGLLLVF